MVEVNMRMNMVFRRIPASLELASKASAITCSRAGAAVSIPTMEEVK